MKDRTNSFVSTLISVAPALIQIFAFFAIDFSDKLKLNTILLNSENLNLINIAALFVSLIIIGIYSYWKSNSFLIKMRRVSSSAQGGTNGETGTTQPQNSFIPEQQTIFRLLKAAVCVGIISLLIFIVIISCRNILNIKFYYLFVIAQWLSYIFLLVSVSFIIFIWLEDIKRKEDFSSEREIFTARVLEKLRDYGWLTPTKIHVSTPGQGQDRFLVIEINEDTMLSVRTSFDGKEIIEVKKIDQWPPTSATT